MPTITFTRIERDCPANKNGRNPPTGRNRQLIYDYNVLIGGEHRLTMQRIYTGKGYEISDADGRPIGASEWRKNIGQKVDTQGDFEEAVTTLLKKGLIPTLAEMADKRVAEQAERERKAAEEVEAQRVQRIQRAGVNLYVALKYIAKHSGEKTIRAKAEAAIAKAESADI